MNPTDAAGSLLEALLAEAQQWACDDTEDQEQLEAIDHADSPHDKLALLQNSSLVPSHLASAIADALLALDPATYSPDPAPTTQGAAMADPELHRIRDALITVVDASPEDNTPSDVYEIQVHGVSVLIRRRAQGGPATDVPYVHIEDQNEGPGLLLVEVNNGGEHEYPRPSADGAAP
ncbi:hypothetical protein ADL00_23555 [Streptomyces sp. AS58]|uniref:hypothetical protein n=1 Tax=Streptomyces sp. AS58 TaxID=1519489 RepID=UPI0006AE5ABA|nr:hypothetical protein [Streptomyces sp. AS58]KOV62938.1 hypothetical protein ADL00_23555 [Streptomyces sp. AS58]